MSKRFISAEQVEAHLADAHKANPNRVRIEQLYQQMDIIRSEIGRLTTEQELYYSLINMVAQTNEKRAMVKCMSDNELGVHIIELFMGHLHNDMDQAIFDEMLDRIGYKYEDDGEGI